jgi:ketosteroid isomerase-like protein
MKNMLNELKKVKRRLDALEDREQIQELRASYCFLVDDGRFDELVDTCFTEDAECNFRSANGDVGPFVSKGSEEVRVFFGQVVASLLEDMSHTIHNHRIAIDGDRASGDCYFEVTARDPATGEAVVGAGRYLDRYRRVDERWRFEKREAVLFHMAPLTEGWVKRPFLATLEAAGAANQG